MIKLYIKNTKIKNGLCCVPLLLRHFKHIEYVLLLLSSSSSSSAVLQKYPLVEKTSGDNLEDKSGVEPLKVVRC